jgi:flagellar hook-associated protein 1 FlgK
VSSDSTSAAYDKTSKYYKPEFDSSDPAYAATAVADAEKAYESLLVSNPANTAENKYNPDITDSSGNIVAKGNPLYDATLDSTNADYDPAAYASKLSSYLSEDRPLFSTIGNPAPTTITAANIKISDKWLDDPMYLTITQPGDNSEGENIGRMTVAIERGFTFYKDGDTVNGKKIFDGTLEEYFTGVNATLGLDVSLHDNYSKTSTQVMTTLFRSRESVSGVNMDEEGVALMAYQKSYNAAVRFFTVLDEAVNTIVNSMGLVGR